VADERPDAAPATAPAPSHSTGFAYRPALDGLRALAVLAVIAYHDNYSWARGGFLGVDTFFVLSGFLITTLLVLEYRRRSTIRLGAFWARRARRLLPALLLVLAFVAVYTHAVALPWDRENIRGDGLASLFYVANWRFIFAGQGYFELFSAASPLRHMWSLAIEEQYYLVWPLVVLACLRLGRGSVRMLTVVSIVGAAASVAAMRVRFVPSDPSPAYYATDARVHTILVGALLALLLLTWEPSARARRAILAVGLAAVVMMFAAFHSATGTSATYYRGGSFGFALVVAAVIAGALQPGLLSRTLSTTPLVWIGRISYGLYLWHWPITVWLVPSRVSLGTNALNALRLGVTFAAAITSYVLIERPIRERSFRPRTALIAFAPAAALIAMIVWVSASGAKPPPSYLVGTQPSPTAVAALAPGDAPPDFPWGYGDPLICGEPRPDESAEAVDAAQREPALALPNNVTQQRVLLLGDSTACSLWPGLRAVGDQQGIATDEGSVFGCGIAIDQFTSTRNEAVTPNSARCRPFLDWAIPRALARSRPTTILWMSVWEKSDLVVDGRTIVADTPEWETEMMGRMDATLAELTANGAHVVLVTEAAPAPNPAQSTETYDRAADDNGYLRLNGLLRRFAARHPDNVSLVDLAAKLCPDGPPCPENVDGLHARPDGRHFTPTSAVWAARFLLTEVYGSR
jgi:peptidoglycan/LPS O-acetylase OafA/YrhL